MSERESIMRSFRPSSRRLYESSRYLSFCLKSHKEATCTAVEETASETPTLAALARHYRLGQLLRVIAALIVVQEKLFRRLEKRPNNLAKNTFPDLFKAMDDESRAILKVSRDFSVEKEDRYYMESNINLIRDSLQAILDAFRCAYASRYQRPGRLDNKMADVVEDLGVDWTRVCSIEEDLPIRYPVDYGQTQEKH